MPLPHRAHPPAQRVRSPAHCGGSRPPCRMASAHATKNFRFWVGGKAGSGPAVLAISAGVPVSPGNPRKRERPRSRAFPCLQMGCTKLLLVIEAHSDRDRLNLCGRLQQQHTSGSSEGQSSSHNPRSARSLQRQDRTPAMLHHHPHCSGPYLGEEIVCCLADQVLSYLGVRTCNSFGSAQFRQTKPPIFHTPVIASSRAITGDREVAAGVLLKVP